MFNLQRVGLMAAALTDDGIDEPSVVREAMKYYCFPLSPMIILSHPPTDRRAPHLPHTQGQDPPAVPDASGAWPAGMPRPVVPEYARCAWRVLVRIRYVATPTGEKSTFSSLS